MSGHSKWATTHRQKEANDSKKGAVFTKLANAITIAVKEGGGVADPDSNFKLRLVMDKARQANMPKDNITRAIERAAGGAGGDLMESLFEGFLPGGVGVLVSTLSDNKLRIAQQVREVIGKHGGTLGNSGSVAHLFSQLGEIVTSKKSGTSDDDQELELIDAGVEEIETEPDKWILYFDKDKTTPVRQKVFGLGYKIESVELMMKPLALAEVSDPLIKEKVENILSLLEDLDDVLKVWTNYQPV